MSDQNSPYMDLEFERFLIGSIERAAPEATYIETTVSPADVAGDVGYGTRISELINYLNRELATRGSSHRVIPNSWDLCWDRNQLRFRLQLRAVGLGDLVGLPVRGEM